MPYLLELLVVFKPLYFRLVKLWKSSQHATPCSYLASLYIFIDTKEKLLRLNKFGLLLHIYKCHNIVVCIGTLLYYTISNMYILIIGLLTSWWKTSFVEDDLFPWSSTPTSTTTPISDCIGSDCFSLLALLREDDLSLLELHPYPLVVTIVISTWTTHSIWNI